MWAMLTVIVGFVALPLASLAPVAARTITPDASSSTLTPDSFATFVGLFGDGAVQNPSDITVGPDGSVWVTEMATDQVLQFDQDGNLLRAFGETGNGPGQFEFADFGAIDLDSDGNVYVLDTGNQRIQKFTPELAFEGQWGGNGTDPGEFLHPSDIAVRDDGMNFVVDAKSGRVQQFDASGVLVQEIIPTGLADQFFEPARLGLDPAGNLYVPDLTRVYVFDRDGRPLRTIQTGEVDNGQIWLGNGVEVSPSGVLYVGDLQANQIAVINPDGIVVGYWGSHGSAPGQFDEVDTLVLDEAGRMLVLDFANQRIQIFEVTEPPRGTPVALAA